eukprot:TRINITY_DN13056_c0_g2_i1.p1 TRINITY_DN13056_c0_g2~~TRINITY_DN13056_c0_g2_i1.p1  ORF type:complete len:697 (-),score=131.88 TRINITY_DN13056_c0_g2_i1:5-2095(-)
MHTLANLPSSGDVGNPYSDRVGLSDCPGPAFESSKVLGLGGEHSLELAASEAPTWSRTPPCFDSALWAQAFAAGMQQQQQLHQQQLQQRLEQIQQQQSLPTTDPTAPSAADSWNQQRVVTATPSTVTGVVPSQFPLDPAVTDGTGDVDGLCAEISSAVQSFLAGGSVDEESDSEADTPVASLEDTNVPTSSKQEIGFRPEDIWAPPPCMTPLPAKRPLITPATTFTSSPEAAAALAAAPVEATSSPTPSLMPLPYTAARTNPTVSRTPLVVPSCDVAVTTASAPTTTAMAASTNSSHSVAACAVQPPQPNSSVDCSRGGCLSSGRNGVEADSGGDVGNAAQHVQSLLMPPLSKQEMGTKFQMAESKMPSKANSGRSQEDFLILLQRRRLPPELESEKLEAAQASVLSCVESLYRDRLRPVMGHLLSRLRESHSSEVVAQSVLPLCARMPDRYHILPPMQGDPPVILLKREPRWFQGWVDPKASDESYDDDVWDEFVDFLRNGLVDGLPAPPSNAAKELRRRKLARLQHLSLAELEHLVRLSLSPQRCLLQESGDLIRPCLLARKNVLSADGASAAKDGNNTVIGDDIADVLEQLMRQFSDGMQHSDLKKHIQARCKTSFGDASSRSARLTAIFSMENIERLASATESPAVAVVTRKAAAGGSVHGDAAGACATAASAASAAPGQVARVRGRRQAAN